MNEPKDWKIGIYYNYPTIDAFVYDKDTDLRKNGVLNCFYENCTKPCDKRAIVCYGNHDDYDALKKLLNTNEYKIDEDEKRNKKFNLKNVNNYVIDNMLKVCKTNITMM